MTDKTFREKFLGLFGGESTEAKRENYRHSLTDAEKSDIDRMSSDGMKVADIAEEIKRPYKTVDAYLRKTQQIGTTQMQDPLREHRLELEKIKLDIEKTKLEMQKNDAKHQQTMQELELKARLQEMEEEDDGDDDDGFNAGQLLMSILEKARTGNPVQSAGPLHAQTGTPPMPSAQPATTDMAAQHIAAIGGPTIDEPKAESSKMTRKQIVQLASYIKANRWNEEETVAEALKRGRTEAEARAFYRDYVDQDGKA